ncbi:MULTISPECIES: LolA-like outer membrane lipoprotein chaperone [unclassified Campylobacter]|uniref:LolA-like outer membrane lipoprotein chaperone n=1 Tax=unclassified Campylobacter TaxID=2593542 RepID=UPI000EA9E262|nr:MULTISPECIES: LolA-like outer membrane lipoprotein chaperone [unclassified Campylobacter]QOR01685.1 outer membrane lipoprotein chaperone LolA [Campylobacter sp. 2014D-0216]RKO65231.1 outer-membrane lipoprotein carrier protein [Campylobacter sp. P255]
MRIFLSLFFLLYNSFAFDINFQNFSSDFEQKVTSNNATLNYKGNFIITQNKAFWNYTQPNQKQIYINHKEVVIIEPELEQVIYTHLQNLPNLQEIFKQAKQISKEKYEAKYENITYFIQLKNDKLNDISYKDELENSVSIHFFNQKFDQKINDEVFLPKIPSHFDIIQ